MRSERGQGTVEWIAIVLLVAIVLATVGRLAPRGDDRGLATTLMHSVTCATRDGCKSARTPATRPRPGVVGIRSGKRTASQPPRHEAFTAPPLVPLPRGPTLPWWADRPSVRALLRSVRRAGGPELRRAIASRFRRGAGEAWRRAWLGCLVYERFRWAFLHPESRFPGYTMPPSEVLRIANDCISPVDLVRDWSLLMGR